MARKGWSSVARPVPAAQTSLMGGVNRTEVVVTLSHLQLEDLLLEGGCLGLQSLPLLFLLSHGL